MHTSHIAVNWAHPTPTTGSCSDAQTSGRLRTNIRSCSHSGSWPLLSAVSKKGPILLANPLQRSKRTFSWGSFLSFFAFKEGMWDTHIAALLSSPTVTHDPRLSTAYENSPAIFS